MNCFKTYSIFMAAIFILSIRKLHATPPEIQRKINICIRKIRDLFGAGDTYEHGSIAIEHFRHLPESKVYSLRTGQWQTECCMNTINNQTDNGDIFHYYLSFKPYLHVGEIPDYSTFCQRLQRTLICKTEQCVNILNSYFGENKFDALIKMFYDSYECDLQSPKCLAKTVNYVEPSSSDGSQQSNIVLEEGQYVVDNEGNPVDDISQGVFVLDSEGRFVLDDNGQAVVINQSPSVFFYEGDDVPENTINLPELYLQRVKQTYGLNTVDMPDPESFCNTRHNPPH